MTKTSDVVARALARHRADSTRLLQILWEAQEELDWISPETARAVAVGLGVPITRVQSVVRFYSLLYERPRGRYRVLFSDNITDRMLGAGPLVEHMLKRLKLRRGQVSADGAVSVDFTSCTGMCEKGWYRVGPLARVQVCDAMPTPLAEAERRKFVEAGGGKPLHGALMYHWARMIEMLHAAELARECLDDPDIVGTDLMADKGARRGEAVGVIEAPRGTLFHHYRVDENDLVAYCNLIVSTTSNNQAMNEAIRAVASRFLSGREVTEGLLNHVEIAIRAYDPCLSCATHALGQMPLEIDLVDAGGALVSTLRKG